MARGAALSAGSHIYQKPLTTRTIDSGETFGRLVQRFNANLRGKNRVAFAGQTGRRTRPIRAVNSPAASDNLPLIGLMMDQLGGFVRRTIDERQSLGTGTYVASALNTRYVIVVVNRGRRHVARLVAGSYATRHDATRANR